MSAAGLCSTNTQSFYTEPLSISDRSYYWRIRKVGTDSEGQLMVRWRLRNSATVTDVSFPPGLLKPVIGTLPWGIPSNDILKTLAMAPLQTQHQENRPPPPISV